MVGGGVALHQRNINIKQAENLKKLTCRLLPNPNLNIIQPKHIKAVRIGSSSAFEGDLESIE